MSTLLVLVFLILLGCNKEGTQNFGVDVPANLKPVKLGEVLENPTQYNGKQVLMKGVISGQCASLCELFIRDGAHQATFFAEGFKYPKLESEKPVSIYVNITSGPENVVFSALGLRVEEGNEK